MSRFLQITLMVLTAILCGVCVWQWKRENRAWQTHQVVLEELASARKLETSQAAKITQWEAEIARLNAAVAAAHQPELKAQAEESAKQLATASAALTQQQQAAQALQAQLKTALEERDKLAADLNKRTREFNDLAEKYRKAR